jgi:potassium-transporting ATPase KdpC subunit
MKKNLITSALAVLAFTLLFGIAYPLVVTGIAQVAFPDRADGSPIRQDGKIVGSTLLAGNYTQPVPGGAKDETEPNPKYFQPRPSATGWSPSATFFANRGPNQSSARFFYRDQLAAYLKLEGPYNPGLTNAKVPADAVTMSGSGVDPLISEANARIQARRVAAARGLAPARIDELIAESTDGRFLGVLGEPGVNVTKLNLALDAEGTR